MKNRSETAMARPVRVASICLAPDPSIPPEEVFIKTVRPQEVLSEARKAAHAGVDLILTPEVWSGDTAEPIGSAIDDYFSPVLEQCREIARMGQCYFVVCMSRYIPSEREEEIRRRDTEGCLRGVKRLKANSSILLDRQGKIVYIYDKVYPYPPEFNLGDGVLMNVAEMMASGVQEEAVVPGNHIGVVDCDFGRLGLAICFDMNFTSLWEQMAQAGVELVAWSAAFSGGSNAARYAGSYHYYVVTSTSVARGDCRVADITGQELIVRYPQDNELTTLTFTVLDLDRKVFHKNFNEGKLAEAQKRYPGKLLIDTSFYDEEEWLIVASSDGEISVESVCKEYGLVPLQQFQTNVLPDYIAQIRNQMNPGELKG